MQRVISHQTLQLALGALHAAEVLPDVRRSGGRCDEKGVQQMSFGDGDLHVQVAQLKTENARLKQRNGELERLVRDWAMAPCAVCDPWDEHFSCEHFDGRDCTLGVRMTELGIVWEVD